MQWLISPTKRMRVDSDSFQVQTRPEFLTQAHQLKTFLQSLNFEQLQMLWHASTQIVTKSQQQLKTSPALTPALMAYCGLQYQSMSPATFSTQALTYVAQHLRILSGLYGLLRPFDGIRPYRLEMRQVLNGFSPSSLYDFWGDQLYRSLYQKETVVINLASQEYTKVISPFVHDGQALITVAFMTKSHTGWRQQATHAKMARGSMIRFAAEQQLQSPQSLKPFHDFGFAFDDTASTPSHYVFKTTFDFKSAFNKS